MPLPQGKSIDPISLFLDSLIDPLAPSAAGKDTIANKVGMLLGALPIFPFRNFRRPGGGALLSDSLEKIRDSLPHQVRTILSKYQKTGGVDALKMHRNELLNEMKSHPKVLDNVQSQIHDLLGDEFSVYRGLGWNTPVNNRMPNLTEPRSYSLDPRIADRFGISDNYYSNSNPGSGLIIKTRATPKSVIVPGYSGEKELLIDPQAAQVRHVIRRKYGPYLENPFDAEREIKREILYKGLKSPIAPSENVLKKVIR